MSPQVAETQPLFCALKALLEELRAELREDARARQRLQQQYAGDKAAWDVEWAALTCRLEQVRPGLLSDCGEGLDPRAWLGKGLGETHSNGLGYLGSRPPSCGAILPSSSLSQGVKHGPHPAVFQKQHLFPYSV